MLDIEGSVQMRAAREHVSKNAILECSFERRVIKGGVKCSSLLDGIALQLRRLS